MTIKLYKVSVTLSGEQGEVMRRDYRMPLTMLGLLNESMHLLAHYESLANALNIGPVKLKSVMAQYGLSEKDAVKLLVAAGATQVYVGKDSHTIYWGFEH